MRKKTVVKVENIDGLDIYVDKSTLSRDLDKKQDIERSLGQSAPTSIRKMSLGEE